MMITSIDEAIASAKEVARKNRADAKFWNKVKGVGVFTDKNSEHMFNVCEERAEHQEQLVSWLEELKERRETDRWISVEERMPEPRVAVMVYCPERKNQYCAFYADKHWQVFGAYDTVWEEVTHWKPLSQDPQESEATSEA